MDDLKFLFGTLDDLNDAHTAGCEAFNAIEELQQTALWERLPIGTRRALCAAHAHLDVLTDQLAEII